MVKPIHLFFSIAISAVVFFILGLIVSTCGPKDDLPNHKLDSLHQEIAKRDFNEKNLKDTIKAERDHKAMIIKDNTYLRKRAEKSEARYRQLSQIIPETAHDSITILMQDTTRCDSAIVDSKKLVAGLTIEIITDNAIIKNQDSLITDLNLDKANLQKIDTLHQEKEKTLEKKNKKNFWKGIKWGAIGLAILEGLIKLATLVLL